MREVTNMKVSSIRFLWNYSKKHKFTLLACLLCALIYVIGHLCFTILTGMTIDLIIGQDNVIFDRVNIYLIVLLVITIVALSFEWMLNYFTAKITYKIIRDMRRDAFNKISDLPISYIDSHAYGDVISKVVLDVETITDGLLQLFTKFVVGVTTIVGTLIMMCLICWPLALIVLLLTPLSLISSSLIARGSLKTFRGQTIIRGDIGGFLNENLTNQKIIKSYNSEDFMNERFDDMNKDYKKVNYKSELIASIINPSTRLINALIYATLVLVGGVFTYENMFNLTSGLLYSFLLFANRYTTPFNDISNVVAELQNSFASARRLAIFLKEEEIVRDEKEELDNIDGSIDIETITFSYDGTKDVLKDISIDIRPKHLIALVGSTGCGKTTLINLLMKFYSPQKGKILMSKKDIKDVKTDSLRRSFGMVLQDTWIFKGTIRDNIRYSKPDASEEEIIEASKKARAHGFISNLKDGYDTLISDSEGLSNGQKQLICIARLFLNCPDMLVLDEATSSIDTRTEVLIQQAFNEIMKERTCIVIAHRLSTIRNADLILVMDKGQIVEKGNHKELIEKKGFYYDLYNSQFVEA